MPGDDVVFHEIDVFSSSDANGYYDIHFPVGVGDVALPTVTGDGVE